MKSAAPIAVPISVRWREFRRRFVPALFFIVVLVAVGIGWKNHVAKQMTQGIGEGVRSFVSAPQPGFIQEWLVQPHTVVTSGTPLVIVSPVDARADFDLLRSLFEMARVRLQPSVAEDNAMNFERIRVELLKTKSELAIARVKLKQAERDVVRNEPLYSEKLVSEDIYELSVNTRDALKAEVEEKNKAVVEIERRLEQLRPIGEPDALARETDTEEWLDQLEKAQAAAAKNLEPLTLVAPISGMVALPYRQAGEFVPAGEPLVTINSVRSDRIVAYLRQPYRLDAQVGMNAQVTTRTLKRKVFSSRVAQVGPQMEVLTNSLALWRPGSLVDAGLPIVVPVPDGIDVRPGEVVDVFLTEPASAAPGVPRSRPSL